MFRVSAAQMCFWRKTHLTGTERLHSIYIAIDAENVRSNIWKLDINVFDFFHFETFFIFFLFLKLFLARFLKFKKRRTDIISNVPKTMSKPVKLVSMFPENVSLCKVFKISGSEKMKNFWNEKFGNLKSCFLQSPETSKKT